MDHTKCLYEDVTAKPIRQTTRVNLPGLHNLISDASGGPFASQHYDEAVFNAFKAVEDRVKKLSGNSDIGKAANDRRVQRTSTGARHHVG